MSVERRPCVRCWRPTAVANLVHGFGPDCARLLGLVGNTIDVGQDGPTLFDLLDETGPETALRATLTAGTRLSRDHVAPNPSQTLTEALRRPDRPHGPQPDTPPTPAGTLTPVTSDLTWHKSSRCGTSTCVEIARDGDDWLIRDSKHPDQPALRFTAEEWTAFTAGVENGEFRW